MILTSDDFVGIKPARALNSQWYVIERVAFVTCHVPICLRSVTFRYFIGQNLVDASLFAIV